MKSCRQTVPVCNCSLSTLRTLPSWKMTVYWCSTEVFEVCLLEIMPWDSPAKFWESPCCYLQRKDERWSRLISVNTMPETSMKFLLAQYSTINFTFSPLWITNACVYFPSLSSVFFSCHIKIKIKQTNPASELCNTKINLIYRG